MAANIGLRGFGKVVVVQVMRLFGCVGFDCGHFLVEPLPEGRYFAKFKSNGSEDLVSFAVVRSYDRCDGSHLEINFSKAGKATIQDHIDINDSGEPCQASEPLCYRK
jgi:hypothetical protein